MSNNSLQKVKFDGTKHQSVQSFRQRKRVLIERLGARARRVEQRYHSGDDYLDPHGIPSQERKKRAGKTSGISELYNVVHAPGTTWAERNPDKVRYHTSVIATSPLYSEQNSTPQKHWTKTLQTGIFCYAVFAFISCTTAFELFGVASAAFGLVYLGGLALIAMQVRQFLANPTLLLLALCFPFFALGSIFWGVEPETTLRHAVQLTITALIGASIGCALRPHTLILAMTVAFVALVVVSVANLWLQVVPAFQQRDYLVGNEYFTGVFTHKNTFGLVLCLAALCLAYLASSHSPGWPFAIGLIALLPIFLFARSTTSIALYAFILCMPFMCLYLRFLRFRLLIFLTLVSTVLLIGILMELMSISLIDIVLELAGKGRDMSGRTTLWSIASNQIHERPWLGVGYQSYWSSDLFANEVEIVRGLLEPSIKHFHNTWLEALVGVGILGLLSIVAIPLFLLSRFLYRLCQSEWSPVDVAGLFFIVLMLVRANVETTIYYQHNTESLIMIALLFSTMKYQSFTRKNEQDTSSDNKGSSDDMQQSKHVATDSHYRYSRT